MSRENTAPESADSLPPAELRGRTVRGLRWTMIGRPATELVFLGSMVLLARLVSPSEFGRYAVAALVADLATIPANGVGADMVQRKTAGEEHLQSGFALTLITGTVLVGLTLLAAIVLIDPIFGGRTAYLVQLSTPTCLLAAAAAVPCGVLQRRLQFRRLAVIDVSSAIARATGSIGLALAGLGGVALVLGGLAGWLVVAALACIWARPPRPRIHRAAAREVLRYALPAATASVSWVGFRNCDYAIVSARLGAFQGGLYFRAYTLGVEYQKKVSLVMGTVGFPVLARTRDSDEMHAVRRQMVGLLTVVLFPLLALLAVLAPVLVPWMFGPNWVGAVVPTQILAVGGASTLVIDAVGATLMASGRAKALMGYGWGHFLAYGGAVFLIAPLGLAAVATAAAVVHTAFLIVAYALMTRRVGPACVVELVRDTAPALLSCAALVAATVPASLVLSAAGAPALLHLAAVGILGAVVYAIALRVCFSQSWQRLAGLVAQLLPVHRVDGVTRGPSLAGSGAS